MSSSVSKPVASSIVMTPSLPTLSIACAIISPVSRSSLAEIVPTWAISSLVETVFDTFLMSLTTEATARSMPRRRSIGFMPAATVPLDALAHNGLGQHRCGCRAIARLIAGPGGDFLDHLRAHVLEPVAQFDLLRDRDAVLGDTRRAVGFVEKDVAPLGAKRHLHRIRENVDAAKHPVACVAVKFNFFGCHVANSLVRRLSDRQLIDRSLRGGRPLS